MCRDVVLPDIERRGVATVALNRAAVNNACDDAVIAGPTRTVGECAENSPVRIAVIRANGQRCQAGAYLEWLQQMAKLAAQENVEVSRRTAMAVPGLKSCPSPHWLRFMEAASAAAGAQSPPIELRQSAVDGVSERSEKLRPMRLIGKPADGAGYDHLGSVVVFVANMVRCKDSVGIRIPDATPKGASIIVRELVGHGRLWAEPLAGLE